jgi:cytochrome P450
VTASPSLGPSVADLAQQMLDELVRLRRQKAVDDALSPLVRDLAMATVAALNDLRAAAHRVIEAWRSSSLSDPDPAELRAAIEALVEVSGWRRTDDAEVGAK